MDAEQKKQKRIAICVPTCMRPKGLKRLLESLSVQEGIAAQKYAIRIVVVDNDTTGENDRVVDLCQEACPFPITQALEPERGISHARNKAVEEAWEDDALIFLDDDEVVSPVWLSLMLQTWEDTKADVVTGPVDSNLPECAPNWAKKSRTFNDVRTHKTREIVGKAYTNNTLVSQRVFRAIQPAFDPYFSFTGSEDIHYFQRVVQQGYKIVWCAEAKVHENVPESRITLAWLIKRSFRTGSGDTISRLRNAPSFKTYLIVMAMGLIRFARGFYNLIKGTILLDWHFVIKGVRVFFSGVGTYAGLVGISYNEYKTIHGE